MTPLESLERRARVFASGKAIADDGVPNVLAELIAYLRGRNDAALFDARERLDEYKREVERREEYLAGADLRLSSALSRAEAAERERDEARVRRDALTRDLEALIRGAARDKNWQSATDLGGALYIELRELRTPTPPPPKVPEVTVVQNGDRWLVWFGARGVAWSNLRQEAERMRDTLENALSAHWPKAAGKEDPYTRNPEPAQCACGLMTVEAGFDGVNWYWQRHGRTACTLELPNLRCWCGLLRSEHVAGHAEKPAAQPPEPAAKACERCDGSGVQPCACGEADCRWPCPGCNTGHTAEKGATLTESAASPNTPQGGAANLARPSGAPDDVGSNPAAADTSSPAAPDVEAVLKMPEVQPVEAMVRAELKKLPPCDLFSTMGIRAIVGLVEAATRRARVEATEDIRRVWESFRSQMTVNGVSSHGMVGIWFRGGGRANVDAFMAVERALAAADDASAKERP